MNSRFPQVITEQRKKRKLSQKQVAADLGISQALLSHYEKGIRECGLDFVVRIADYYNVSCDCLLGRTSPESGSIQTPDTANDVETVKKAAARILSACRNAGGEEFEKEIFDFMILNFYKLFRIISEKNDNSSLFSIPDIPAENLADSVIMNICASIKLKSSDSPVKLTDEDTDNSFLQLIRKSENKISQFHSFYHSV